jgi:hypothetical protein
MLVSRDASLPHVAFTLQSVKTTGCNTFALLRSHLPSLQQKFANALSDAQGPHCFA